MRSRRRIGELVLAVALAAGVAGCGGGGTKPASTYVPPEITTLSPVAVKAAVTAAWKTFFSGATPIAKRVALLAGGQRFASTIKALSQNPLASATLATVSNVTVTGPTSATVTFSVLLAGTPVLTDVKGSAVLSHGTWLVDAGSLCKLLALQGSLPPACPSAGSTP